MLACPPTNDAFNFQILTHLGWCIGIGLGPESVLLLSSEARGGGGGGEMSTMASVLHALSDSSTEW
ncbi:hypothetical protein L195_g006605 [Trifolium pratense]|uniref:Uncharacterized protein n=1 Tax=Trifolium pratense TaxID=57577 RepID=A0A2K3P447_TRIPR|nr:hypothetical protein L195_g006605 [Trifolium pratense]